MASSTETKTKLISFSKKNKDVYDILMEAGNASELVCEAIRFFVENKEREETKKADLDISLIRDIVREIVKEEIEQLKEERKEKEEIVDVEDKKEEVIEKESSKSIENIEEGLNLNNIGSKLMNTIKSFDPDKIG